MTSPIQTELAHLIALMNPHREAWKAFCWDKAQKLAENDPKEYGDLPRLLKEAMSPPSSPSGGVATGSSSTTAQPLKG